jgi:hypothetical protein
MDALFGFLIFAGVFAVFNALRIINNNILKQTAEVKQLREELSKNNEK